MVVRDNSEYRASAGFEAERMAAWNAVDRDHREVHAGDVLVALAHNVRSELDPQYDEKIDWPTIFCSPLPYTKAAKTLFLAAHEEANKEGDTTISITHLCVALLRASAEERQSLLNALGVSEEKARFLGIW